MAMPDWSTFKVLPWAQGNERTAFVFCDVLDRDYKPFEGDPRWVLRRQLERARRHGPRLLRRTRARVLLLQERRRRPELTDDGGYFDVLPADLGNDLRKQTMRTLDRLGIPMEASHHEVAPSQHEIDPHYDEALAHGRPGHDHAPHRQGGRGPQRRPRDLHAQAAARAERQRHARAPVALPRRRQRLLLAQTTRTTCRDIAKGFIAGQLRHMREICSLLNQWVNSFKRLVPGYEAPVYISWAHRNRTALIRVPLYIQGKESTRARRGAQPRPGGQPVPGLRRHAGRRPRGHRAGVRAAAARGAQHLQDGRRASARPSAWARCPTTSTRRSRETQESELVRRTLGDHVFERFVTNKLNEWYEYREQVTDWEIERVLLGAVRDGAGGGGRRERPPRAAAASLTRHGSAGRPSRATGSAARSRTAAGAAPCSASPAASTRPSSPRSPSAPSRATRSASSCPATATRTTPTTRLWSPTHFERAVRDRRPGPRLRRPARGSSAAPAPTSPARASRPPTSSRACA